MSVQINNSAGGLPTIQNKLQGRSSDRPYGIKFLEKGKTNGNNKIKNNR